MKKSFILAALAASFAASALAVNTGPHGPRGPGTANPPIIHPCGGNPGPCTGPHGPHPKP